MCSSLYIPEVGTVPDETGFRAFFANVPRELAAGFLSPDEAAMVRVYYREAGLLDRRFKREFFFQHFARNLAAGFTFLFDDDRPRRFLDLGCGTGTQTIVAAILGMTVVGVDMDEATLDIARKRVRWYEAHIGRSLDVHLVAGNALELDYAALGPFECVFSLFAFNMMQPTRRLVARLSPGLTSEVRLVIQDGNCRMWFNRIFRRRAVCNAAELCRELDGIGLRATAAGGYALPPIAWIIPGLAEPVDRWLRAHEIFAGSWVHFAKRVG